MPVNSGPDTKGEAIRAAIKLKTVVAELAGALSHGHADVAWSLLMEGEASVRAQVEILYAALEGEDHG